MSEKAFSMDKVPKCPNCEENMEKGYVIASGGAIFWSEKPRKWTTFGFEHLILASPLFSQANVEAYRCSKCKIVLFSYEKKNQLRERCMNKRITTRRLYEILALVLLALLIIIVLVVSGGDLPYFPLA